MARITRPAAVVGGEPDSILFQTLQGVRGVLPMRFTEDDSDAALDVSAWAFAVERAELAYGSLEKDVIGRLRLPADQPTLGMPEVATNTGEVGRVDLTVPAELLPSDFEIALDTVRNVPVVVIYVKFTKGPGGAEDMVRVMVAVRRGA